MSWEPRRRRLNWRLFSALLLVAVLAPVGIQLVHLFQVSRSARVMLFRAEAASAEGRTEEAIRCYRYYVNYRPDDDEVFGKLALLSADQFKASRGGNRELWQVYPMLEEAALRNPDNTELVRRLADLSVRVGRSGVAAEQLLRLTQANPADLDLQLKLARCMVSLGEYRRAAAAYETVVARDAKNVDAMVEYADLLRRRLAKPQQADALMQRLVAANPDVAKARLERARYLWRQGQRPLASSELAAAMGLAPENVDVLLTAGDFATAARQFDKAQEYLARAQKLQPTDERIERAMIALKTANGSSTEAIELLQRALERQPDDFRTLVGLADLQLRIPDIAAAKATVEAMEKARISRAVTAFFQARIDMMEGKWQEAAAEFERLRAGRFTAEFGKQLELFLAYCYEQLALPDRELEAYERLLAGDPNLLAARMGYAGALFQARKYDRALEEYTRLLRAMGVDEFVKYRPLRNNYYHLLSAHFLRLPEAQRDWPQLERLLAKVEQLPEADQVETSLLRADLALKRGRSDQARQIVADRLQQNAGDVRLRTALANIVASQDPEQALTLLQSSGGTGDSVDLRLARANLALRVGTVRGTAILKALEAGAEQFQPADRIRLWQGLASMYNQLRNRGQAKRLWRLAADARPDDRQVRLTMFQTAIEADDEAGMLEALAELEKSGGRESPEWRYGEAARLVWQVRNRQMARQLLATAAAHLKQVVRDRPQWQAVYTLQAEIAVMEGRLDDALVEFRRANQLSGLESGPLGQYIRVLYIRGRYDEASEILGRAAARLTTASMKMLGSELRMRSGKEEASVELAAETVAESRNPIDFWWYGQILARAGRGEEAEMAFRRAVGLNQTIPELWHSLVNQLTANKKKQEAYEIVRTAQVYLPEDQAPLLLAQCYEMLGDGGMAEQYYMSAISLEPNNYPVVQRVASFFARLGRLDKARQYLQRMLGLGAQAEGASWMSLAWARRTLATMLVADGGYIHQEQAIALLDQNALGGRLGPDDLRIKASILSARPLVRSQLEAIALFEQARRGDATPRAGEDYLLAQLYNKTDQWSKCQTEMTLLIRRYPKQPELLAGYIEMMFDRGLSPDSIETWVNRLEKTQPAAPATLALRARLLGRQGKPADAARLLTDALPRPVTPKDFERAGLFAATLEQIDEHAAARALLEELAKIDQRGRLALAAFLARRGETAAALETCEKATSLPAAERLEAVITLLGIAGANVGEAELDRATAIFQSVLRENPADKACLLQWAALLDLRGRYAQSIQVYRDFLNRDDLSERERAIIYNNLGYLLVTRRESVREAIELIDRAIAVLGPSPQLRDTRALALLANGQPKEAVEELKKAVADHPTGVNYFHLAVAHMAAKDATAAAAALQSARKDHKLTERAIPQIEQPMYRELLGKLGAL